MSKKEMAKKKSGEQVEEPTQVNPISEDVQEQNNLEVPAEVSANSNVESKLKTEEKPIDVSAEKLGGQKQESGDAIAPTNLLLKVESRSTLGKVSSNDFKPSAEGWYTSFNDAKKRYNPGVFSNNQIGKFGTLRVFEDGSVEFITHTDFEKRKKRFKESGETFTVKLVSEKHGILEYKNIEIQF